MGTVTPLSSLNNIYIEAFKEKCKLELEKEELTKQLIVRITGKLTNTAYIGSRNGIETYLTCLHEDKDEKTSVTTARHYGTISKLY